jgi:GntR family transcriptional regulator
MTSRPLYAELAEELVRDIRSEKYPVGSLLPTEIELASTRKISRSTARAALNHLATLGLVSRHKGIGTRVTASQVSTDYNASTTTLDELAHFGAATERRICRIEKVVADDVLAGRLDGRAGKRWVKISATRADPSTDSPPICWTENYLDERYEKITKEIPAFNGLIVNLIGEDFGVSIEEVEQSIRAVVMAGDVASVLSADENAPALEITRRYKSLQAVEMISISVHPADRFEYRMSLRRPRNA